MNFEIKIDDIKKLISNAKNERNELGKIINPILDNYDLEKKEILEVCQIGKFVLKVDANIKIKEKPQPPAPDFVIEYESKLIGLEHTRILTKNADRHLRIVTLLDFAETIYSSKYSDCNVHAIISIKNDELNYKQSEKSDLANLIADLVYSARSGKAIQLPDFISNLRTTRHSKITFTYDERNWQSELLTKNRLEKEIKKKEKKIIGYKKSEQGLSEYWLVLLIGSLSSISYELDENENYETESKFDRVYLMADFDADIIKVK